MKKTVIATSIAMVLGAATPADAAFTALGDGDYRISITGGCFDFGNCVTKGTGLLTDNTTANQADSSSFGFPFGSGIVNDGFVGVIDFTLTNGNIAVTSFSQDSYLNTAGGTFYLRSTDNSTMGGTINNSGSIIFDPTGRQGAAAAFATTIGEQPWNFDDFGTGAPNSYNTWVTGTSTNRKQGFSAGFTLTGAPLQDAGINSWTGTLVSAGNIGTAWGTSFENTQFSEVFNITIDLVAADPVANDDTVSGTAGTNITINIASDLLSNDTHADATEDIIFDSFTQPLAAGSSVSLDPGGTTLTYSPDPSLTAGVAVDSFDYTVVDNNNDPSTATVNITLVPATANPPVANDDIVSTNEDTQVAFDPVAGINYSIVADTDPDSGQTATLTISNFDTTTTELGTVTAGTGNNLTYAPAGDFNGADTFQYTIIDDDGLTDSATVTVNVASVNDAPVCNDVDFTTAVDEPLAINVDDQLLSTTSTPPLCVDADGDTLSLSTFETLTSEGGTVSSDGAGTLTYTPPSGFAGEDTFTFTATDSIANASPKTVTINVADPSLSNFTMLEKSGGTFGGTNDVVFIWDEVSFNSIATNAEGIPTDTNFGLVQISSPHEFFNFNWRAHHIRIFKNTTSAPLALKFDVTCEASDYDAGIVNCDKPMSVQGAKQRFITMTLQPGEIGGHMLFDWGKPEPTSCGVNSCNIDVVNLWQENVEWTNPDGQVGFDSGASPKNDLWLGEAGIPPALDAIWRLVSSDANGDGINGMPMVDGAFLGFSANFNYEPSGEGEEVPPFEGNIEEVKIGGALSVSYMWMYLGLIPLIRYFSKKQNYS